MLVNGNIAVVTGGGSGMGAETAQHLAKAGARVAVLDRDLASATKVAQEIDGLAITCDVASDSSATMAVQEIINKWSAPRICVNCAGIISAQTMVKKDGASMPLEDFSRVIHVNLIGTFNMMRLIAAEMSKLAPIGDSQERGVIINTASIAAFEGQIGQMAYSASKGGVAAMTLPAARELARFGIRVLAIAPGLIATPMLHGLPDNIRESLASEIPFPKRFGEPAEFAKLVLHIIDNAMLNGTVIRLDGALRLAPK